ncbi:MAG: Hsp20/alpha crystallin family protein [Devosia sp.]|nr:Hsp20/alpha crystallin family protein [Devosia sp.]
MVPSLWDETGKLLSFESLHKQIDRIFAEFHNNVGLPSSIGNGGTFDFLPSAELHDAEKEVAIRIELPGVEMKNVDISVADRSIDISGEKKSETERRNGENYRTERSFGSFRRSFTLPFMINADKVDARFDKGVLTVKIAKPAEAQTHTRKIAVHG